ncbi:MAG TPA: hypothetical protein PKW15_01835 [Alphaproteobacteria bacterium]|nr:hypothetical protein [Alphaproteobacteria bacterium]
MSKENAFFNNFGNVQETFEDIQKTQSAFITKFLNSGMELQKKQYELLTNIVQNQIEFGNSFLTEGLNIINDNIHAATKKEPKGK